MTIHQRRLRLLAASAAGALTIGALALTPAASALPEGTEAAERAGATRVSTEQQLRRAIARANRSEGPDRIRLVDDITFADRSAAGGVRRGDLDVTDDLTVVGLGHTLDASRVDRVFDVGADARLTVRRATLTRGAPAAGESGGAIRSLGTLELLGTTITRSRATGAEASGGAVMNEGGRLLLVDTRLSRNRATRAGGAIESLEGRTTVRASRLIGNATGSEPGNGGALHLTGAGDVLVRGSLVARNSAAAEGGGLWNSAEGTFRVEDSIVRGNRAGGDAADEGGGALFNDGGSLTVTGSALEKNRATGEAGSGGGVLTDGGTLMIRASQLVGNVAQRAGGGIEAVAGQTTVRRTRLAGNRTGAAPGNGGALHLTGAGAVDVVDSSVIGNRAAAEGGGLWNSAEGTFSVVDTLLRGNVAGGDAADEGGGALFNDGGQLTVTSSTLLGNTANGEAGSGGGIINDGGALVVEDSRLSGNDAVRAGGGIETVGGSVSLTEVTMRRNATGANPGNGGALHLTDSAVVTWQGGEVTSNDAAAEGGGLWNSTTGTLIADELVLRDNTAPVGPDAFNDGGLFLLNGEPVPSGG